MPVLLYINALYLLHVKYLSFINKYKRTNTSIIWNSICKVKCKSALVVWPQNRGFHWVISVALWWWSKSDIFQAFNNTSTPRTYSHHTVIKKGYFSVIFYLVSEHLIYVQYVLPCYMQAYLLTGISLFLLSFFVNQRFWYLIFVPDLCILNNM